MSHKKTALVTGASRGIGACVAEGLSKAGYNLAILARSEKSLEDTKASVERHSSCLAKCGDVSDERFVSEVIKETEKDLGPIEVVVNNAGINYRGSLNPSYEQFDQLMAVNIRGVYNVLREVSPLLVRRKKGHIFNIASIAGKVGYGGSGAYASTKFAVVGLSESLFHDLAPSNVKVTAICPSWVNTDMAAHAQLPPEGMIQVEDIWKTIEYLLSLSPAASPKEIVINCVMIEEARRKKSNSE